MTIALHSGALHSGAIGSADLELSPGQSAAERRRFGYRRLGIMLAREGIVMNHKKLLRLYREENLRVRRRRGRKRAMGPGHR